MPSLSLLKRSPLKLRKAQRDSDAEAGKAREEVAWTDEDSGSPRDSDADGQDSADPNGKRRRRRSTGRDILSGLLNRTGRGALKSPLRGSTSTSVPEEPLSPSDETKPPRRKDTAV
ncbi:hypothetical protein NKR23_g1692 [Pleurostoma richardsiae]|uniref:Uncharacterized protein n=1 Tax=Pleurostoma richardsiae TaxID=41990 RepID=A0AA38RRU0_9PEZI|nr:hypothetical protein NKR23_g1692 [Pleurostoma richardsiae]